jgi:DNA-binding GntR family transcriptional regulator
MKTNNVESASDYAYKTIKEMVVQSVLVPGQKIVLDQLAEKIKLSKTPIIYALNRLEREDFVISIRNRGFFIKEIGLKEFNELYRVRGALEVLAAEESIEYGTADKLKRVKEAMLARNNHNYNDEVNSRKRLSLDAKFHLAIAEMSGNSNLYKLLRQAMEQILIRQRDVRVLPRRLEETPKEHQEILNAIEKRDMKMAKIKVKNHIQKAREAAVKAMQKNSEPFEI